MSTASLGTKINFSLVFLVQSDSSEEEVEDEEVQVGKKGRGRPKKTGSNDIEVKLATLGLFI